ncbi:hypothetical protein [Arenibacter echinorum]|uniref:Parallel beta helix pectate lyase-like protein n=1 Tax=Arenibacter echinorum TaxID=440515 RepID=A0A327QQ48_9FLAO|nr:hypothetical protein [Arenibacter echinorum]RAJ05834.1 hypothetical protein LV92_04182 [Arenibacter echinorum]
MDFDYTKSNGSLEFSKDTVFLDTIFRNIGSSTYTLKVYNRSSTDISIPTIQLKNGDNSKYRLNVDGESGQIFSDIPLYAQDSLYIFVETTADIGNTDAKEFLHTDAIQFDKENHLQEVQLVTLIKDAIFLYPARSLNGEREKIVLDIKESGEEIKVEGFELGPDQLNFTKDKPYVIYGYAAVPEGKTLSMEAGTRVHFHKDSGILIKENASLHINGELSEDRDLLENEVVFEGDRLEPNYSDIPGQWGSIWLSKGSVNNKIHYLTIKNATVGILVQGDNNLEETTLSLKNSQIYNSENVNLWAKTAIIRSENLVLGAAGNISLFCNLGGDYSFIHATIANYWKYGFRSGAALHLDNSTLSGGISNSLTRADFKNCIIYGSNPNELTLIKDEDSVFNFYFENCLLKFKNNSENELYNFGNTFNYEDVLLNLDPEFTSPIQNNFIIKENSSAIGAGNLATAQLVPLDILGADRTKNPTLGAYEVLFTP